ncbi:MAG: formyltransferase family protein [Pseudomonadota bacterium]
MRVILFAEEAAGARVLRALDNRSEEVTAVVTSCDDQESSGMNVASVANTLGYRVIPAGTLSKQEMVSFVREQRADILLNVHSLHILPPDVIAAPSIGSFNLHPGPLPELAGLNAPSWAIFNGNTEHAVTLHWMLEGIDTGPIAYAERFPLSEQDTGLTVSAKCVTLGVPLIDKLLDIANDSPQGIPRVSQNQGKRKLYKRSDLPNEGWIDWSNTSRQVAAFVRAADYGPFPSPWGPPQCRSGDLTFGLVNVKVQSDAISAPEGTVLEICDRTAIVATGDGAVAIHRLHMDGEFFDAAEVLEAGRVLESFPLNHGVGA